MTARLLIGDVRKRIREIPDGSIDFLCTSPPFLALRKYGDDSENEMGSEATPAAFIDALLGLTAEFRRVLAPHGSIAVELGDTYSGSGGAGGDYNEGGRDGQTKFDGSALRSRQRGSDDPVVGRDEHEADVGSRRGRTAQPRFRQGYMRQDGRKNASQNRYAEEAIPVTGRGGPGWPLAKSLCLTPYAYPMALAYGHNPLNGQPSPAGQWRVRNMIAWCRPNPPIGALGDKVRPGTSYITVACVSDRRWFDLDAVRTEHKEGPPSEATAISRRRALNRAAPGNHTEGAVTGITSNPAGAPPLDWWEDDYDADDLAHLALILPTQPYSGWTTTTRQVPCGPLDGGVRTTSPDCPVHADLPGQLPKALRDARAGNASSSKPRSDSHHEQGLLLDSVPTVPSGAPTTAQPAPSPEGSPAASGRSTPSSRTDPAPSTSAPGTSSAGTAEDTPGTSTPPESDGQHPGTPSSRTFEDAPSSRTPESESSTAGIPAPEAACTCSFHQTITERTSHYAVWPKTLARRLIEMMCPREVCTQCGAPRRRLTSEPEYVESAHFTGSGNPMTDDNRRADGARSWGAGSRVRSTDTIGWSDCGCPNGPSRKSRGLSRFRPGVTLDPFAGSGTTLAVAVGCGRDAIGIELYPKNADLIRERVGMFLEEVA